MNEEFPIDFIMNNYFKMKIPFSEIVQVVTQRTNKLVSVMISMNVREWMSHATWIRKCAIMCPAVTNV